MTKLEELKAARDAAYVADDMAADTYAAYEDAATYAAADAAWRDARDARAAYRAELKKTQEENPSD